MHGLRCRRPTSVEPLIEVERRGNRTRGTSEARSLVLTRNDASAADLPGPGPPPTRFLGRRTNIDQGLSSEVLAQTAEDSVIHRLIPALRKHYVDVVLQARDRDLSM